jgi:hypothetical protein
MLKFARYENFTLPWSGQSKVQGVAGYSALWTPGMQDERKKSVAYSLSYLITCKYSVNGRYLTNVSFFFSLHTLIIGHINYMHDEKIILLTSSSI